MVYIQGQFQLQIKLIIHEKNDVIVNCIKFVYTFDKMELTMIIIYCSAQY